MDKKSWKKTCKKISSFLARVVHFVLESLDRRYKKTKHHYFCIYTSTLDTLFNAKTVAGKGKRGAYVRNSMRSIMLPFEQSEHKSAKKLLQHAEKQRLDLSLNPYRVLHSSIHNELGSQKLKKMNATVSYKKTHNQSNKVFMGKQGGTSADLYHFSKYEENNNVQDPLNPTTRSDPRLWQHDLSVGSIVEI